MDTSGEVRIGFFITLMTHYVSGKISADEYARSIFDTFAHKRLDLPQGEPEEIITRAYGDADDYDPKIKLPYTYTEDELRKRVTTALERLLELGYSAV
jgi:hypothetical protein